ncbi:MAG: hypothetical protein K2J66_01030 [Muribaculaceae bacterium]|nr:hypothetical protein [Muribaculaceae bacterium]
MKFYKKAMLAAAVAAGLVAFESQATGWPADYEGVMLQGFYWDSFNETSWSKLEANSDELSRYFKLIWVPNSAKSDYYPGMGYDPVYWFSNHNSAFGSEDELRSMIKTFKSKGTGIIEDVVINHRMGVTGKTDFPAEEWNGQTWQIGLEGITGNDEINSDPNQPHSWGADDTGLNWPGMCDLDHTNANVQNNCKNYCKFLIDDMGYTGFRYDYAMGYGGEYIKIYNQYSQPQFSVAENWTDSYDVIAAWIEATGRESAAFDFPFKFKANEAFHSNDMTKLVWKANGVEDQPAGMIHYGYSQFAVTFLDNHDTAREETNFHGNIPAANAYMLCSPGTPCVFYSHWTEYKDEIKRLIDVRNSVGVNNTSKVKVLQSSTDCYMAEVTGKRGKLVIRVGSASASPEGYADSDIVTSGIDYCVWAKYDAPTSELYLVGNFNGWNSATAYVPSRSDNGVFIWDNVWMNAADNDISTYFSFLTTRDADWNIVNGSDRFGATAADYEVGETAPLKRFVGGNEAWESNAWKADAGVYRVIADIPNLTLTLIKLSTIDGAPYGYPSELYLMGGFNNWDPTTAVAGQHGEDGVYIWYDVELPAAKGDTGSFFSFTTIRDGAWDTVNYSDRYGAPTKDNEIRQEAYIRYFQGGVDAASAYSWKADAGVYTIEANLREMKLKVTKTAPGANNYPYSLYMTGSFNGWNTSTSVAPDQHKNGVYLWERISLPASDGDTAAYFSFVTKNGDTWDIVNCFDRYGATYQDADTKVAPSIRFFAGGDDAWNSMPWRVPAGDYRIIADFRNMTISATRIGDENADYPSELYLIGNLNGWNPETSLAPDHTDRGIYTWNKVALPDAGNENASYLSFVTARHNSWDAVNTHHRFGATEDNAILDSEADIKMFHGDINAQKAYAWKTPVGNYKVVADLRNMKVSLTPIVTSVDMIDTDEDAEAVYYNMQGIRVDNPSAGLYIVVRGNKVTKEIVR